MRILLIARDTEVIGTLKPLVSWGHRIMVCPDLDKAESSLKPNAADLVLADSKEIAGDLSEWCRQHGLPLALLTEDKERQPGLIGQLPRFPDKGQLQNFVDAVAPGVDPVPLQYESAMTICDDDEELFRDIVEVFLGDAPNQVEAARKGFAENALDQVARAAHAMKGASGNIAAEPLRESAQNLERAAKKGDASAAKASFSQLQYEFCRLKQHISQELGIG